MEQFPEVQDGVRVRIDGSTMRVTLCSPDNRNSQTPAMWRRLEAAAALAQAEGVSAVVLDAEGKSFSAGLDRRMFTPEGIPGETSLMRLSASSDEQIDAAIAEYQRGFSVFTDGPFVSIALVQGHAVGAGFQLALACDLIICAEDAQFSMRESAYGLVPDLTGTSRLTRTAGYARALEICVTARWVDAAEARDLGLALAVVPGDGLQAAGQGLVDTIANQVPGTAVAMKSLIRSAEVAAPEIQRDVERRAQIGRLRTLAAVMAAG
jgi:enoyl-CoA hydratase/carnithine racemase